MKSDHDKFESLKTDLLNSYLKGRDEFPESIMDAYFLLNNYQTSAKPRANTTTGVSFAQGNSNNGNNNRNRRNNNNSNNSNNQNRGNSNNQNRNNVNSNQNNSQNATPNSTANNPYCNKCKKWGHKPQNCTQGNNNSNASQATTNAQTSTQDQAMQLFTIQEH